MTTTERPGATVERVERARRVATLRGDQQVRLVDWSLDEPLQAAVDRATAGWES